jgi:hypothetical protein
MTPEIAEVCRAEQCVAERVRRDVGVGVSNEARRIGNGNEAEPKSPRRVVAHSMHIETVTDPHERTMDARFERSPGRVIFTF